MKNTRIISRYAERMDALDDSEELFSSQIPFWLEHGVDREFGGFFHSLDYDGRLVASDKFHWFQGRGVWVFSFLYNHFGGDPEWLAVARATKDFMLRAFPQPDGWWAETVTRDGRVVQPFRDDLYGILFAVEGLQEYAAAAGDEQALETARGLLRRVWEHTHQPAYGARPQGLWMVQLRIATQMLRRQSDPFLEEVAGESFDAILNRHYNPVLGLNNEVLAFDFSRLPGEESISMPGHSIESLWMAIDEAGRRRDRQSALLAAERIRRHLEAGWDAVHGGLAEGVNVGKTDYEWPVVRPVGTSLQFRCRGEYLWVKPLWALNEILFAMKMVLNLDPAAEWPHLYIKQSRRLIAEKYSQRHRGLPGYQLFSDREFTPQLHVQRQDNYHPMRQMMLCGRTP